MPASRGYTRKTERLWRKRQKPSDAGGSSIIKIIPGRRASSGDKQVYRMIQRLKTSSCSADTGQDRPSTFPSADETRGRKCSGCPAEIRSDAVVSSNRVQCRARLRAAGKTAVGKDVRCHRYHSYAQRPQKEIQP